jgi:hypothetical protein
MLESYLVSARSSNMTQRAAGALYKVPRRTIHIRLKGKHFNRPGKPIVFSSEEEVFAFYS